MCVLFYRANDVLACMFKEDGICGAAVFSHSAWFTRAGWKNVSQRGQRLYHVVLWCVRVMSLAELTGLKEQVPFLEGSVWEEVKSLKSALHYNPEQGVEKA